MTVSRQLDLAGQSGFLEKACCYGYRVKKANLLPMRVGNAAVRAGKREVKEVIFDATDT